MGSARISLLHLPRELRDRIYDEAFNLAIDPGFPIPRAGYDGINGSQARARTRPPPYVNLMRTCRQVRDELSATVREHRLKGHVSEYAFLHIAGGPRKEAAGTGTNASGTDDASFEHRLTVQSLPLDTSAGAKVESRSASASQTSPIDLPTLVVTVLLSGPDSSLAVGWEDPPSEEEAQASTAASEPIRGAKTALLRGLLQAILDGEEPYVGRSGYHPRGFRSVRVRVLYRPSGVGSVLDDSLFQKDRNWRSELLKRERARHMQAERAFAAIYRTVWSRGELWTTIRGRVMELNLRDLEAAHHNRRGLRGEDSSRPDMDTGALVTWHGKGGPRLENPEWMSGARISWSRHCLHDDYY